MNFLQGRIFFSGQHLRHPSPTEASANPSQQDPNLFFIPPAFTPQDRRKPR